MVEEGLEGVAAAASRIGEVVAGATDSPVAEEVDFQVEGAVAATDLVGGIEFDI